VIFRTNEILARGGVAMSTGSTNLVTWQKIAVVLIVIFGLIITFSYFQSSRLDEQPVTTDVVVPPLEESQSNADLFGLPMPEESLPAESTAVVSDVKTSQVVAVPESAPVSAAVKPGTFGIQAASFKEMGKAQKLQQKLKEQGYEADIGEKNLGEKGTWYQVLVGQHATKAEADTQLTEIKTKYPDSFTRKR